MLASRLMACITAQHRTWHHGPLLAEAVQVGSFLRRLVLGAGRARLLLHQHLRSDPRPYLHSHPLEMVSIILSGGYLELRPGRGWRCYRAGGRRLNFISSTTYHRIVPLARGAWTLVLCWERADGRWGFLDPVTGERIAHDSPAGVELRAVKRQGRES